ncbi:MAG: winged helix-turn-helix transcriptional regulator [Candidatus Woesearchaeota archaeon]
MDALDRKILAVLFGDVRIPIPRLAHLVRAPISTTNYRVERLINEGFITPTVRIEEENLGFYSFFVMVKVKADTVKRNIAEFLKHRNLGWAVRTVGAYNLLMEFLVRDITEQERITNDLSRIAGKDILAIQGLIAHKGYVFDHLLPDAGTHGPYKPWTLQFQKMTHVEPLDLLDKRILAALRVDARKSIVDISKQCESSAQLVLYRMKRLKKNEIITRFTAIPNYGKLGYSKYALFLNFTKDPDALGVGPWLHQENGIRYAVQHLGKNGVYILFIAKEEREVFSFLDRCSEQFIEHISGYEIFPVIEKYYENLIAPCIVNP